MESDEKNVTTQLKYAPKRKGGEDHQNFED